MGESAGHAFRGNQWTGGIGGQGSSQGEGSNTGTSSRGDYRVDRNSANIHYSSADTDDAEARKLHGVMIDKTLEIRAAKENLSPENAALVKPIDDLLNAPYRVRGMVKDEIVTDLGKRVADELLARSSTPGAMDSAGREALYARTKAQAQEFVDAWAKTSGDHSPEAIMLQDTVREFFNLDADTMSHLTRTTESGYARENRGAAARDFIKAEYAATQEYLKSNGIEYVTLYRGMAVPPGTIGGGANEITSQPASSWSVSLDAAKAFAVLREGESKAPFSIKQGGDEVEYRSTKVGKVVMVRVHRSRILSTAVTGRGCLDEGEVLLIGGRMTVAQYTGD